jgi:hypothetical protein
MNIFPSTVWVTRAGIHLLKCPPLYFVFSHDTWGVSQGEKKSKQLFTLDKAFSHGLY